MARVLECSRSVAVGRWMLISFITFPDGHFVECLLPRSYREKIKFWSSSSSSPIVAPSALDDLPLHFSFPGTRPLMTLYYCQSEWAMEIFILIEAILIPVLVADEKTYYKSVVYACIWSNQISCGFPFPSSPLRPLGGQSTRYIDFVICLSLFLFYIPTDIL